MTQHSSSSLYVCMFVCSFVRSFVRSFVCSIVRLFVCLFANALDVSNKQNEHAQNVVEKEREEESEKNSGHCDPPKSRDQLGGLRSFGRVTNRYLLSYLFCCGASAPTRI